MEPRLVLEDESVALELVDLQVCPIPVLVRARRGLLLPGGLRALLPRHDDPSVGTWAGELAHVVETRARMQLRAMNKLLTV